MSVVRRNPVTRLSRVCEHDDARRTKQPGAAGRDFRRPVVLHGFSLVAIISKPLSGTMLPPSPAGTRLTKSSAWSTVMVRTRSRSPLSLISRQHSPCGVLTQTCTSPTGFSGVPPPGPAIAGHSDRHITSGLSNETVGHLPCNLRTDRPMLRKRFRADIRVPCAWPNRHTPHSRVRIPPKYPAHSPVWPR